MRPSNPDQSAPCLYEGEVMHMRLTPFRHQFRYRVFSMLLDIDRLEETCAGLRLLSLDRFNLLSFRRRDHGPRDGSALRPWVEAELIRNGRPKPARVWLLSFPRILGYVFNPLSVYFCEDRHGRLESVIYEVKNTFGDQHCYVLSARADRDGASRHEEAKDFYVSPFIGIDQTYAFTIRPPGERLSLRIRQRDENGPWLIATQTGKRRPLSDAGLLRVWARHPLMTIKVFGAIHWQALKLALKGAAFRPYRGAYPHKETARTEKATEIARPAQQGAR
ncbi:DUF1365 domain-containing protein [Rhodobacteraceae bacterium NNCM2]|nr:DUF1365 domain-containing protein [Coraliihabitans acroporae]